MNRPTILEIDLRALDFNLKNLKRSVTSAKFYPVIKADAYGHGVTVHNEQFAEDAAENWCLGYIE